jgi:hypothetical protein
MYNIVRVVVLNPERVSAFRNRSKVKHYVRFALNLEVVVANVGISVLIGILVVLVSDC